MQFKLSQTHSSSLVYWEVIHHLKEHVKPHEPPGYKPQNPTRNMQEMNPDVPHAKGPSKEHPYSKEDEEDLHTGSNEHEVLDLLEDPSYFYRDDKVPKESAEHLDFWKEISGKALVFKGFLLVHEYFFLNVHIIELADGVKLNSACFSEAI